MIPDMPVGKSTLLWTTLTPFLICSALSEPPDLESKLKSFEDSSRQLKSKADNILQPLTQISSTDIEKKLPETDADLTKILAEIDAFLENNYVKLGKEIDDMSSVLSASGLPPQRQQKLQLDFSHFRDRRTESFQILHSGKKRLVEGRAKVKTIQSVHAAVLEIGGPEDANEILRKIIGEPPTPSPESRQTLATGRGPSNDVKNKDTYRLFVAPGTAPAHLMKGPSETSGRIVQLMNTTSNITLSGGPQGPDSAWFPVKVGNIAGFLRRESLCLTESPLGVRICPGPNRESWQQAIAKYPNLAVPGSDMQRKFAEQARLTLLSQPKFFASGDWPLQIAKAITSSAKPPTQSVDWMADPVVKSADENLRKLFETLTRQTKNEHLSAVGLSVSQLEKDQSEWLQKRQSDVSAQPPSGQREVAISITRDRTDLINHLINLVTRTREVAETQQTRGNYPSTTSMTVADFVQAGAKLPLEKRTMLSGKFIVTAISANQAVLRPFVDHKVRALVPSARVIAEFPKGGPIPPVNSTLTGNNLFEVQYVRLGKDSEVNIYVRHIQHR